MRSEKTDTELNAAAARICGLIVHESEDMKGSKYLYTKDECWDSRRTYGWDPISLPQCTAVLMGEMIKRGYTIKIEGPFTKIDRSGPPEMWAQCWHGESRGHDCYASTWTRAFTEAAVGAIASGGGK